MNILELFSGTASFSNVAKERGHNTFTVDINPIFKPDLCKDILDLKVEDVPFKPDIIWASPPCTTFSCASIGHHWKNHKPITKEAEMGLNIITYTLEIIKGLKPRFYLIENPMGMLRVQEVMKGLPRQTITYCQYGDTRMKPTDIWTNLNWIGKRCKYKAPCHIRTPRGSRKGTQGLKDAIQRAIVPRELCEDILNACEKTSTEEIKP